MKVTIVLIYAPIYTFLFYRQLNDVFDGQQCEEDRLDHDGLSLGSRPDTTIPATNVHLRHIRLLEEGILHQLFVIGSLERVLDEAVTREEQIGGELGRA